MLPCRARLEDSLLRQIHITRQNACSQPDVWLDEEFLRVFANEPIEAVEFAFRCWRDQSPYFPKISEIRELIANWRANYTIREADARRRREQADMEAARAAGGGMTDEEKAELAASIRRAKEKIAQAGMNPYAHGQAAREERPPTMIYVSEDDWIRRANEAKARLRLRYPEKFGTEGA